MTTQELSRIPLRTPSVLAVLLSAWLGCSTFLLHYFMTIDGQDAALRDRFLTLLTLLLSVCWLRARNHRRVYLLAFAVVAALLGLESFAFAYGPGGQLAWPWWNEKITAVAMLLCCVAGWGGAGSEEAWLREGAWRPQA